MQFAETKDYILVRHTQDTILASYRGDMSKYNNLNEIKKTRLAYDNITKCALYPRGESEGLYGAFGNWERRHPK